MSSPQRADSELVKMVDEEENHFIRVVLGFPEMRYVLYRESSRGEAEKKIKRLQRETGIYVGIETLISKKDFDVTRGADIIFKL